MWETGRREEYQSEAAQRRSEDVANRYAKEVSDGNVAPPSPIEPEQVKHENFGQDPGKKRGGQLLAVLPGNAEIEPQLECGHSGDDKYRYLNQALYPPVKAGEPAHHATDIEEDFKFGHGSQDS